MHCDACCLVHMGVPVSVSSNRAIGEKFVEL